jgi:hypothetical protein
MIPYLTRLRPPRKPPTALAWYGLYENLILRWDGGRAILRLIRSDHDRDVAVGYALTPQDCRVLAAKLTEIADWIES